MTDHPVLALYSGGGFFEGPRWHDGRWWVSDFYRHQVATYDAVGAETVLFQLDTQPSGLGWFSDGTLVVASMKDHKLLTWADGELTELADLSEHCGGHLNDLVVDANDHVFVGNFGFDLMGGGEPATTSIVRVDRDGTVTVAAEDVAFPNGSVVTPDGSTLIVGETMGNRYTAWVIGEDGTLTNRREWASFGAAPTGTETAEVMGQIVVAPDGCTLDAEGHIWAADALANRCIRIAPGGEIVDEIPGPGGLGVFACQLGGDDGRTLLLCCAPDFFEHNRSTAREAMLATTRVEVPHAGLP